MPLTQADIERLRRTDRNEYRRLRQAGLIDQHGNLAANPPEAMGLEICNDFPQWQKEKTEREFSSPQIQSADLTRVRQVSEIIVSQDGNYQNPGYAALRSFSNVMATQNTVKQTVWKFTPADAYDHLYITAVDFTGTGGRTWIAMGWEPPAAIDTQGFTVHTPEVFHTSINTGLVWDLANARNAPAWVSGNFLNAPYTQLEVACHLTNKPFYVWFYDGQSGTVPPTLFRVTWDAINH